MCKELPLSMVCELTPNRDGFSVCSAFPGNAELLNREHESHCKSLGRQIVS